MGRVGKRLGRIEADRTARRDGGRPARAPVTKVDFLFFRPGPRGSPPIRCTPYVVDGRTIWIDDD